MLWNTTTFFAVFLSFWPALQGQEKLPWQEALSAEISKEIRAEVEKLLAPRTLPKDAYELQAQVNLEAQKDGSQNFLLKNISFRAEIKRQYKNEVEANLLRRAINTVLVQQGFIVGRSSDAVSLSDMPTATVIVVIADEEPEHSMKTSTLAAIAVLLLGLVYLLLPHPKKWVEQIPNQAASSSSELHPFFPSPPTNAEANPIDLRPNEGSWHFSALEFATPEQLSMLFESISFDEALILMRCMKPSIRTRLLERLPIQNAIKKRIQKSLAEKKLLTEDLEKNPAVLHKKRRKHQTQDRHQLHQNV